MKERAENLLKRCLEYGILTTEPIRKYPLRPANLQVVLKALAVSLLLPYEINLHRTEDIPDGTYYLTPVGFDWLIDTFKQKSLEYNRVVYQFVFSKAKNMKDLENYEGMRNFKGETGIKRKAGSKQSAVLVRRFGPKQLYKKEFPFDTLHEAREHVFELLKYYPAEEFTLYRVRRQLRNGREDVFREKIPLVIDRSRPNNKFSR